MQLAMRMREQFNSGHLHPDGNISRIGRKRDDKREIKMSEREETKSSSLMGPPLSI